MVSLVVPGSSERMLAKAHDLRLAEVVVDLEDAVAPARKAEALAISVRALERGFAARRVSVRVNPIGSLWCEAELDALATAAAPPDSVVVPKADDPEELIRVSERLGGIGVQPLIESATGLQRVGELAGAGPQVEALILGYADLAVSLGRNPAGAANLDLWLAVQDRVLVAARGAGVQAIDGPFLVIDDEPGLRESASRAAQLGFDGKWVIHPAHIAPVVEEFTPDEEAVARARAVVEALARAERAGDGAARLDGAMIDEAVRLAALRTLALAGEIEA